MKGFWAAIAAAVTVGAMAAPAIAWDEQLIERNCSAKNYENIRALEEAPYGSRTLDAVAALPWGVTIDQATARITRATGLPAPRPSREFRIVYYGYHQNGGEWTVILSFGAEDRFYDYTVLTTGDDADPCEWQRSEPDV